MQQLAAYAEGLRTWLKRDHTEMVRKYPALAECTKREGNEVALTLATTTETYELCTSAVRNELGELLNEVSADVTENAE